jgi:hypothetical protein
VTCNNRHRDRRDADRWSVGQGWSQHQDREGGQRFQEFEADKLMFMRLDTWSGRASICVVRGKSEGEEREGVVRCYPWSE